MHFNPRPPRGERRRFVSTLPSGCKFQSTPSARRATSSGLLVSGVHLYFNPRPPRGERLTREYYYSGREQFQSTPSARRATRNTQKRGGMEKISIHALREESDKKCESVCNCCADFNPRPPRGERLDAVIEGAVSLIFQSTPSARRATFCLFEIFTQRFQFQSTPSARRATTPVRALCRASAISIHALREESDFTRAPAAISARNFNPRPPRGERLIRILFSNGAW